MEIRTGTIVVARNVEMFATIGGHSFFRDALGIITDIEDGSVAVVFSPFITEKKGRNLRKKMLSR